MRSVALLKSILPDNLRFDHRLILLEGNCNEVKFVQDADHNWFWYSRFFFAYASCVRACDTVLQSHALLRMLCSVMLLHHCFELCVLFPFRKLPQQIYFYIFGWIKFCRLHAERGLVQHWLCTSVIFVLLKFNCFL